MTGRPRRGPVCGPPRGQAPTFSPLSPVRPAGPWGPGLPGRPYREASKHISQKPGSPELNHFPSRTPRPPHWKSRLALSSATNPWSWGTLRKDSGSRDGHEIQNPSHPQGTWPLTYPFPTITFVTLEDKHDPMTTDHTHPPQDTRRVTGSNSIIKIMGAGCGGARL